MLKKYYMPSAVTLLRLLAAPLFLYLFFDNQYVLSLIILILAGFTDLLDGYLARKMNATSNMGAYLDVTVDFILIMTCFMAFVIKGWYDPLILLIIVAMFILFVATSGLKKPVYDPVGKYLGAFLMGMIFLSIIFYWDSLWNVLSVLIALFSIISVGSRLFFFLKRVRRIFVT
ncbi:MAG TPA: CDP-alcohol phosphatidyltransferase family protein [Methanobacteriaceae archaeon]|nr:CDP-alcohol phosphatidyltransferase family protein [Methanobacteriaceae archaeon]